MKKNMCQSFNIDRKNVKICLKSAKQKDLKINKKHFIFKHTFDIILAMDTFEIKSDAFPFLVIL